MVTFDVTRSDGRLTAPKDGACPADLPTGNPRYQAVTDSQGEVRACWRLGSDAGSGNNRLAVTSRDIVGTTVSCASATAAPADQINIGSGNNQRAEVFGPAREPLQVWVSDECNGVEGVPVTFSVTEGGGLVNGQNSVVVASVASGHAEVDFTLGSEPGLNVVEASIESDPKEPVEPAVFSIVGVPRNENLPTHLTGVVFDNSLQAIQGATCTMTVGGEDIPQIETDIDGQFQIDLTGLSGTAHLIVDGSTAFHIGGEQGTDVPTDTFPALSYELFLIPNAPNALPGPILLPRLEPGNRKLYSTTEDTVLTIEGLIDPETEEPLLKFTVKAGSMKIDGEPAPDGTPLSLNPVHADEIPMPMPDGSAPALA